VERERVIRRVKKRKYEYILHMYENRTMKPIEIVPKKRERMM
jgi:hypothetical protein